MIHSSFSFSSSITILIHVKTVAPTINRLRTLLASKDAVMEASKKARQGNKIGSLHNDYG
jgi:hypothetical protein